MATPPAPQFHLTAPPRYVWMSASWLSCLGSKASVDRQLRCWGRPRRSRLSWPGLRHLRRAPMGWLEPGATGFRLRPTSFAAQSWWAREPAGRCRPGHRQRRRHRPCHPIGASGRGAGDLLHDDRRDAVKKGLMALCAHRRRESRPDFWPATDPSTARWRDTAPASSRGMRASCPGTSSDGLDCPTGLLHCSGFPWDGRVPREL